MRNHGTRWTEDHKKRLRDAVENSERLKTSNRWRYIAAVFGRSETAVKRMASKLGAKMKP